MLKKPRWVNKIDAGNKTCKKKLPITGQHWNKVSVGNEMKYVFIYAGQNKKKI